MYVDNGLNKLMGVKCDKCGKLDVCKVCHLCNDCKEFKRKGFWDWLKR